VAVEFCNIQLRIARIRPRIAANARTRCEPAMVC
jgi:hypothetical protein